MKPTRLLLGTLLVLVVSACGQPSRSESIFTSGSHSHSADMPGSDGHQHTADRSIGDTPPPSAGANDPASTIPNSYDARFINNMASHHNGALQMAEQALHESRRSEIKQLAEHMIDDQHTEIQQMAGWLEAWYPGARVSADEAMPMDAMAISQDQSKPFDLRFLETMILHHQGALTMAQEAQTKAEHPELRQLAGEIIKAQSAEIEQMRAWQQQWFAK
jgi:uncharacterized protein (DUF305 family)